MGVNTEIKYDFIFLYAIYMQNYSSHRHLMLGGHGDAVNRMCRCLTPLEFEETVSNVQLIYSFQLLHERGVSRQNTYIVIVCLHSLTLVSTFGFLPKTFIPIPDGPLMVQQTVELKNEELVKGIIFY